MDRLTLCVSWQIISLNWIFLLPTSFGLGSHFIGCGLVLLSFGFHFYLLSFHTKNVCILPWRIPATNSLLLSKEKSTICIGLLLSRRFRFLSLCCYRNHIWFSPNSHLFIYSSSEISSFCISSCDCVCLVLSFVSRIHLSIVLVNFFVDMTVSLRRRFRFGPQFGGHCPLWCGGHSSRSGRQWVTLQGESGSRGKWTFPLLLVIQFQTRPHDTTPLTFVVDQCSVFY